MDRRTFLRLWSYGLLLAHYPSYAASQTGLGVVVDEQRKRIIVRSDQPVTPEQIQEAVAELFDDAAKVPMQLHEDGSVTLAAEWSMAVNTP